MKICIVSHFAYGAMTGGWGGGVERQTARLSRWLAGQGHEVSLLVVDEGQEEETRIDGVRVIKMCRQDAGIPGIRFFHPRWTSLNRAMQKADADLYYQNCGEYITGQVALWCRRKRRRFVYSVASDPDCDPALPEMHTRRERMLYRYGIRSADALIAQTQRQRQMLAEGFGLSAVVLPMPYPGPKDIKDAIETMKVRGPRVLWVGRFAPEKRLEWLLDLATRLPKLQFDVVGKPNRESDSYTDALVARAREIRNVTMHGMIPNERIGEMYERASVLCSTSVFEGFPNTFIEAWSYGVPVVCTVDPDGLISGKEMGLVSTSLEGLENGIVTLLNSADMLKRHSKNARGYFLENHTAEVAMRRFELVFEDALQRPGVSDRRLEL